MLLLLLILFFFVIMTMLMVYTPKLFSLVEKGWAQNELFASYLFLFCFVFFCVDVLCLWM